MHKRFIDFKKLYKSTAKEKAEYRRAGVEFKRRQKRKPQEEPPF